MHASRNSAFMRFTSGIDSVHIINLHHTGIWDFNPEAGRQILTLACNYRENMCIFGSIPTNIFKYKAFEREYNAEL
jgi:hypothetical protein